MRVPGIGSFSPVDTVSWVRAASPSELVHQERTRPPPAQRGAPPNGNPVAAASATNEIRVRSHDAFRQARRASAPAAKTGGANDLVPPPSADDTIADTYPGVRGGTITVNGHSISVTPGSTTLREVVAALDTIPGLFAAVDTATGTIVVAGLIAEKKLEITDSTGLLHALGLQTGGIGVNQAVATTLTEAATTGSVEGGGPVGHGTNQVNNAMQKLAEGPRERDVEGRDEASSVARMLSAVSKGALALPQPPVELFEAILDAARQKT